MPKVAVAVGGLDVDGESESIRTLRETHYSQSVERGLAILECFTPERSVLGIADLADALGMHRSTTHRYVLTLARLGYLVQVARRKYRLALRVTDLGMSAMSSTSLQEHARPHLEELRQRTGLTVTIAVLDGPQALVVDRVSGSRRGLRQIDVVQAPGSRVPAYCTALGKLLLAHLPDREQRLVVGQMTLTKSAPNTISSKRALRAKLQSVRGLSLVAAEEELAPKWCSIAAPVRSNGGETVAALGLDAPSSTIAMGSLVDGLGPHLISTADRISARLGFRREDERPDFGLRAEWGDRG
jgi:IclR family transcriptional regulator, pca regulon regulatory protein